MQCQASQTKLNRPIRQHCAGRARLNRPNRLQQAVPGKPNQTNQAATGSTKQVKPNQPDCIWQCQASQTKLNRPIRQQQSGHTRLNRPNRLQQAVPSKSNQTNQTATGNTKQIKPDQIDCNRQCQASQTKPNRPIKQHQAVQTRLNRQIRLQQPVPGKPTQTNQIATGSTKQAKPD